MPKRRSMTGMAAGLAGKFVSRNNDVDGYWALGLLYRAVAKKGASEISIDLVSRTSIPDTKYSRRMAEPLASWLFDQLHKQGYVREQLVDARIDLHFCVEPTPVQIRTRQTWGDPFACRIVLTDDKGRQWSYARRGWCGKHDSANEWRRGGAKTFWQRLRFR